MNTKIASPVHIASALITDENGEILLLKRSMNNKSRVGMWQFPEGKVHPGETPLSAIKRELKEEIGIEKMGRKIGVFPFKISVLGVNIHSKRHLYKVPVPKEIILSQEHSEYKWFSKKEALGLRLNAGIREIISAL